MSETEKDSTAPARGGHEERDIALKGPLIFGAVIVAGILASLLIVLLTFDRFEAREARAQAPEPALIRGVQDLPPEPRLQMNPAADYRKIRSEEEAKLNGYGWVDEKAGIAHIPIDRAMDLVLEKGLPAREGRDPNGEAKP